MKVRLADGVRRRAELFGGICYVPERDDFFALDAAVYSAVAALSSDWVDPVDGWQQGYVRLAQLGICQTADPITPEHPYSGPSFIGEFSDIPAVGGPLVVNCFSTAHCPLACVYCYADDLMQEEHRLSESEEDLRNVVASARSIPSMVGVITGGDPLARPSRTKQLIESLSGEKALVLDTSGVGDIRTLLDVLESNRVHVRISLDSVDPKLNARLRPVNTKLVGGQLTSAEQALSAVSLCLDRGVAVTVQTVISAKNQHPDQWVDLRDRLLQIGVKNWVLHVATRAGRARKLERIGRGRGHSPVLPGKTVHRNLLGFIKESGQLIDIRCTDSSTTPNSVLLVGNKGDVFTESPTHRGKLCLHQAGSGEMNTAAALGQYFDLKGHTWRYLNWYPWSHDRRGLKRLCYEVPTPNRHIAS